MKSNDEMMVESRIRFLSKMIDSRIVSLSKDLTEAQIADRIEEEFGFKCTVQYVFQVINQN
jgi:hypothetical protein